MKTRPATHEDLIDGAAFIHTCGGEVRWGALQCDCGDLIYLDDIQRLWGPRLLGSSYLVVVPEVIEQMMLVWVDCWNGRHTELVPFDENDKREKVKF